ncbi:MAG: endosialidase [Lachnospiraceae bacterium]|nr:endosialidase [Lachnospiraceae bacterium]
MAVVEGLIQGEMDGSLSFGNHMLTEKAKKEDFEHGGDLFKVKTYATMTKLEKNGMFVYESVPGTSVTHFTEDADGVTFTVEGKEDAQLTIGLEDETEYEIFVNGASIGKMRTSLGGKLSISVELADAGEVAVKICK